MNNFYVYLFLSGLTLFGAGAHFVLLLWSYFEKIKPGIIFNLFFVLLNSCWAAYWLYRVIFTYQAFAWALEL